MKTINDSKIMILGREDLLSKKPKSLYEITTDDIRVDIKILFPDYDIIVFVDENGLSKTLKSKYWSSYMLTQIHMANPIYMLEAEVMRLKDTNLTKEKKDLLEWVLTKIKTLTE